MKIKVLLVMLLLGGLACPHNAPVSANEMEGEGNPQIPIEDFVRSLHPHGVSISSAKQYQSGSIVSHQDNVQKLSQMLKNEDEKPYWSTIVVTLGLIGDSSQIPEIIEFIESTNKKADLTEFEARALKSAIWSLGILINQIIQDKKFEGQVLNKDATSSSRSLYSPSLPEEKESPLKRAKEFLIQQSRSRKGTTLDEKRGFLPPSRLAENKNTIEASLREAAILGLAFADTNETKEELEKIRNAQSDPKLRTWLDQVIQAQQTIHKVGLLCYREPNSQSCQKTD